MALFQRPDDEFIGHCPLSRTLGMSLDQVTAQRRKGTVQPTPSTPYAIYFSERGCAFECLYRHGVDGMEAILSSLC